MTDEKMTDETKLWVAEMSYVFLAFSDGDVVSACIAVETGVIVTRCNEDLAKVRAERDDWKAKASPSCYGCQEYQRACDLTGNHESLESELTAARARIAELEAAESANLRAIGEASGAMYEPDSGPTWPGSWEEQVSMIAGLRESQRHETDRFLRIEELLSNHGCDCECGCSAEEHSEECDRCFPCKVDAALRGVSL